MDILNKKSFHYGHVIVLCCFLIMFVIVGLVMSCAGIFYKPVSSDLGIEVGTLSIYMSVNFLSSTLTLSIAGKLMERYSVRWILTICSLIIAITFIGMSRFNSVWQFYIAGTLFGISLAFLMYLGFPTLLNRWFKSRMGIFIGICSAGSGIGGVLFNPIAGYLITIYGWRMTYLIFGLAIFFIVTPVLALLLRDYPKDKGIKPYGEENKNMDNASLTKKNIDGVTYSKAIKMPIFYGLIAFAFLINAAATLNIFLPTFVQTTGFSVEQSSLVASSAMIGVTVGKVLLGMINDHSAFWGTVTTTGLGIVGLGLLLIGSNMLFMYIGGSFLFGWAYAGVTVQTPMLVRHVFGNKNYAQIYSNISMAIAIGGAIAAGGWGLIADVSSYKTIFSIGIVFLFISGFIGSYSITQKNSRTSTK